MAQTFAQILLHIVFSTKERRASLKEAWRNEWFAYMGGIVRSVGGKALLINGVGDHVHLRLSLAASVAPAEAVRVIKARSSSWVRSRDRSFTWQSGYAVFSVTSRGQRRWGGISPDSGSTTPVSVSKTNWFLC